MRCAVDAYSWLHKGAYSCALELATGNFYWRKQDRDAPYVNYCMHRAKMLKFFGIEPVIVFDGDRLPMKNGEEQQRRQRRAEANKKGMERLQQGNREGATFMFTQSLDISPTMALELIVALKRENVEFVVAPYEADAQIAHLARLGRDKGGVDVVFTEDSDLVAYGCERVCFKLDKFGTCKEVLLADVLKNRTVETHGLQPTTTISDVDKPSESAENVDKDESLPETQEEEQDEHDEEDNDGITATTKTKTKKKKATGKGSRGANSPLSFENWTHDDFLGLCAMSGCDFLENVRNVGFKKAHAFCNANNRSAKAALLAMTEDKKIDVPTDYIEKWQRAVWTFKHALVYDMSMKKLTHLSPLPQELLGKSSDELDFLGKAFANEIAVEIAEGRMDPISRRPFATIAQPQPRYNNNNFNNNDRNMNNNNNNANANNGGPPKIPKVNINSMFAAKKVSEATIAAAAVKTTTTTTMNEIVQSPRRSPRKHQPSSSAQKKKDEEQSRERLAREDLEIAKMLGALEEGTVDDDDELIKKKETPTPNQKKNPRRTPLSSPNKPSLQKIQNITEENAFKRKESSTENAQGIADDEIRNKFSKTTTEDAAATDKKKPILKAPSISRKFGAPAQAKTIFKMDSTGSLKEIKTKPKSISSFFQPIKKKV